MPKNVAERMTDGVTKGMAGRTSSAKVAAYMSPAAVAAAVSTPMSASAAMATPTIPRKQRGTKGKCTEGRKGGPEPAVHSESPANRQCTPNSSSRYIEIVA